MSSMRAITCQTRPGRRQLLPPAYHGANGWAESGNLLAQAAPVLAPRMPCNAPAAPSRRHGGRRREPAGRRAGGGGPLFEEVPAGRAPETGNCA